ncbi:hypothetical protein Scep_012857 [Stephania cephalantha]|uniref:Sulfotransferase domain-containing protein n=1 Tax=Stephania cephalantha TaxID=152367 RepID=A0AAP0P7Z8_9MAGN
MDTTTNNFVNDDSQQEIREFQELIETLPKEKGWITDYSYKYQGFWYCRKTLLHVMACQRRFQARNTDVILVTQPKSGTTWLKSLAFAIMHRSRYTELSQHPLLTHNPHDLVPFMEILDGFKGGSDILDVSSSPRIFATHLPYTSLPESIIKVPTRVVFLCRDPKDTIVSLWHFVIKGRPLELGPFPIEEAHDMFCRGVSTYGPFWEHMLGYWKVSLERPEMVLFMKFEEMKDDIKSQVKRLARHLGCPFSNEEESEGVVENIIKLCSFENLKNLECPHMGKIDISTNEIIRKIRSFKWRAIGSRLSDAEGSGAKAPVAGRPSSQESVNGDVLGERKRFTISFLQNNGIHIEKSALGRQYNVRLDAREFVWLQRVAKGILKREEWVRRSFQGDTRMLFVQIMENHLGKLLRLWRVGLNRYMSILILDDKGKDRSAFFKILSPDYSPTIWAQNAPSSKERSQFDTPRGEFSYTHVPNIPRKHNQITPCISETSEWHLDVVDKNEKNRVLRYEKEPGGVPLLPKQRAGCFITIVTFNSSHVIRIGSKKRASQSIYGMREYFSRSERHMERLGRQGHVMVERRPLSQGCTYIVHAALSSMRKKHATEIVARTQRAAERKGAYVSQEGPQDTSHIEPTIQLEADVELGDDTSDYPSSGAESSSSEIVPDTTELREDPTEDFDLLEPPLLKYKSIIPFNSVVVFGQQTEFNQPPLIQDRAEQDGGGINEIHNVVLALTQALKLLPVQILQPDTKTFYKSDLVPVMGACGITVQQRLVEESREASMKREHKRHHSEINNGPDKRNIK